jgi:hypothetical protein
MSFNKHPFDGEGFNNKLVFEWIGKEYGSAFERIDRDGEHARRDSEWRVCSSCSTFDRMVSAILFFLTYHDL